MNDGVITVLVVVVVGCLLIFVGWPLLKRYNLKEPEVQRKWTDPKHHDKID